jgi:hypothetical protein
LHCTAPMELTPNIYKVAGRKKRSVHTELCNFNWIRNLQQLDSMIQLEEFTLLLMALASVTLSDNKDEIKWIWTANGKYSVASAYNCQFLGAASRLPGQILWKATSDSKSKFFA